MFLIHYSLLFLIIIVCRQICAANSCDLNINVNQVLLSEGFHRNLTYEIVFDQDGRKVVEQYDDCLIALEQSLPPGTFVNPDEFSELRRSNKLNAFPKSKIQLELPAEQSSESSVYVLGQIKWNNAHLWIPVHARYHHSVQGGGFARNLIESPQIFLNCPGRQLNTCGKALNTGSFLCNYSAKEECKWRRVTHTMLTDRLIWDVPVGNLDHYYLVASGTGLVIVIGSLYLLKTIHEFKVTSKSKIS